MIGLLFLAAASTVQTNPSYSVYGIGTASCGAWSAAKTDQSGVRRAAVDWLSGYLTAIGLESSLIYKKSVTENVDIAAATGWIDNYCVAHPLENLGDAASSLMIELVTRSTLAGKLPH